MQERPAIAQPLTNLINDEGQPLYSIALEDRLPVFAPHYSRSSLMSLMLSELLAQALLQINSPMQRQKMLHGSAPRQLRNIILTLPSAMPKPEREIFRRRMQEAIALVWKAMGWHPQDDDFTLAVDRAKSSVPVPQVQMEWDEATCGQMVYLYNETQVNFGGRAGAFFASMARPDRARAADEPAGKTLRIASIDIGGAPPTWPSLSIALMTALAITLKFRRACCSAKALSWRGRYPAGRHPALRAASVTDCI